MMWKEQFMWIREQAQKLFSFLDGKKELLTIPMNNIQTHFDHFKNRITNNYLPKALDSIEKIKQIDIFNRPAH
ncbi:MAG: hypothetical protein HQM14_20335 [SAR324 cluster bacterium]|nr:hypothetical protein [SAR324 cluster bacterium]